MCDMEYSIYFKLFKHPSSLTSFPIWFGRCVRVNNDKDSLWKVKDPNSPKLFADISTNYSIVKWVSSNSKAGVRASDCPISFYFSSISLYYTEFLLHDL